MSEREAEERARARETGTQVLEEHGVEFEQRAETLAGVAVVQVARRPVSRKRLWAYGLVAIAALAGAMAWIKSEFPFMFMDASVYDVYWHAPAGWKPVEQRSPLTLFLYQHPERHVTISGFQYHVENEVNTSPDMDADGLANFYLETTKANQPDWTGKRLEDQQSGDLTFSVIERSRKGKVVFTAYAVRGNTTIGASLAGGDENERYARETLPFFRQFLTGMSLKPTKGRGEGHELPAVQKSALK